MKTNPKNTEDLEVLGRVVVAGNKKADSVNPFMHKNTICIKVAL